ncbi:MAG: acetate/propionate family kinase [Gammaproteobacteria bacterium]|nr:acetate/propionate family kinase [Gammaproteobacteria bacterium]MBU0773016.1 acetate/propionate family kinase [Gammaproteobacteria bacterium]MBU0856490.1 acetate/propionate family kinase [Gammaproteobacteria bacterium]MBU1846900.1 acetate/propionate family kinase [Gammaproteobacteria bacterium]
MSDPVLVLNCGSSSIKFALFDAGTSPLPRAPLWLGKVDGITGAAPTFTESGAAPAPLTLDGAQPYHAALDHIRARVVARLGTRRLAAVAHRVVHGGSKYFEPVRVDAAVLADLKSYIPLAPLHQPFALDAIETLLDAQPGLAQVACFDTAFHHTLPEVEQMLPLSWAAWERGLRRYGFHGLSYAFMSVVLAERYGDAARGRTIVAHLGSGASLCAMQDLKSVATTMGFSALDGLMMGSRCGALDPGAVIYLMEIEKLSLAQVGHLLYHESGLLGLSGVSADPRELLRVEDGNHQVQAALALYVRRIVREIGALAAVLGGLDMLVFTAGIGEHNAIIRRRICDGLAFLGVTLDAQANASGAALVSGAASRVKVAVEPTNEEWIAAQGALAVLSAAAG